MIGTLPACMAELVGTFGLVFAAAGTAAVAPAGGAWAYGAALAALGVSFGAVSGAHFNPALTLVLIGARRVEPFRGVLTLGAQLLGAALAGLLLRAALDASLAGAPAFLGACRLQGVGYKGATLLEAVAAFFVAAAYYGTFFSGRAEWAPAATGAAAAAFAAALAPLTGAALNPARAFGPAVATGVWGHWYVYWIGPLVGAAAASVLYENFFLRKK